jgi:hypothetical protein
VEPRVYIETSVIGYLTARPSRELLVAAHQQVTHQWWKEVRPRCRLIASDLVLQEAGGGDDEAATARLQVLEQLELVTTTEEAATLAEQLVESGAVPRGAGADAFHIAIAVTSGADYLLTWNCRHIANAALRPKIEQVCRALGYRPTILCTPEELLDV